VEDPTVKKLLAAVALSGLLAAGTCTAVALAQAPKKEEPKKPVDTKKDAKGTLAIKPDAKGKYRLYVRDSEGKTLLMSAGAGFDDEKSAKEAFEEVKGIVAAGKVTVEKADEKDK
jgi:uncharacterized protein YegP (UPF0339 family)